MNVSDYIMSFLVERGVDTAFCLTGWGAMGLDDSMMRIMKRYVCARNEAAAPVMAKAWAKLKNKPGLVIVTAGPGVSNAVAGVTECFVDSVPLIVLSGQVPTKDIVPGARTFGTAGINAIELVKPITKFAHLLIDVKSTKDIITHAYDMAMSNRPGPVWIDIPLDLQTQSYG